CQPHRPDAGGGDHPSPAWHPAGPSDSVPGVLVPASNRPIGLLDLVTVSTQLPRPVNGSLLGREVEVERPPGTDRLKQPPQLGWRGRRRPRPPPAPEHDPRGQPAAHPPAPHRATP